ncbi:DUF4748 domain-containing protein [Polyodon spathula]|uniref:DUF4748 domain-containing protein n=1 Tax=Polyodon spathula TaxID=7913 RepID=UPI001B7E9285|nr:DUF4748 domain-containing protein [Polyodon spathula]
MAASCIIRVMGSSAAKGILNSASKCITWRVLPSTDAFAQSSAWQHSRSLHCNPGGALMCSKAESGKPSIEGPEYIPKKKAKNPMMKVGLAWIIGLPSGIIGFLLVKREVDKNRLKQLKIRQRMKKSNEGEYESDRHRTQNTEYPRP